MARCRCCCRSVGAPISMPGMMDTILNLGLCRESATALGRATGDSRFVADVVARPRDVRQGRPPACSIRRAGVAEVVAAVRVDEDPAAVFDRVWAACARAPPIDTGDGVPGWIARAVARRGGGRLPLVEHPACANLPRLHGIRTISAPPSSSSPWCSETSPGDSGSGVVFTPPTPVTKAGLFGEYLAHTARGEDVVAGAPDPRPVTEALAPAVLDELRATCAALERAQGDVLDIEFTVERSTLFLLQVRS